MTARPRQVVILSNALRGGGVERVMLTLAQHFSIRGMNVSIVVLKEGGEFAGEVPEGVERVVLGSRGYLGGLVPLARLLRRVRPDVILSATPLGNATALLAAFLTGLTSRVITTDVMAPHRAYELNGKVRKTFSVGVAKLLGPLARGRIAVSAGVGDELASYLGLPRGRISVIYNPVSVTPEGRGPEHAHSWLGDEWNGPVVISAGRLNPVKDQGTLLRALALARKVQPDLRLVIFGMGPSADELNALAESLGLTDAVDMPGFDLNIRTQMAHCDVFAMSSIREGLCNVLIEALAEGCPVVSTDCPFGPREILEGGKHGRLVPVSDPDAMAEAILAALAEPRIEGDRSHLERFDVERIVDRYERLMFPD